MYAVIGLGSLGQYVARALFAEGQQVLGIDMSRSPDMVLARGDVLLVVATESERTLVVGEGGPWK